ncbi:hypothetical protein ACFLY7_00500 [Patescibacteria group bacterium]
MKKTSYYIIAIVGLGLLITFGWVYKKYFKSNNDELLTFKVERGDIKEVVKVRGEVVAQNEFDLGFPFSGIISSVFVDEGDVVGRFSSLVKLDTKEFSIEKDRLESVLAQNQASLDKLVSGLSLEDINIYETKVSNSEIALSDSKKDLINKMNDAYTKSDDAIRNKVDQFFNNPSSSNPQVKFTTSYSEEALLERERVLIEDVLGKFQVFLSNLNSSSDLDSSLAVIVSYLEKIKDFLNTANLVLNNASASAVVSQAQIDSWETDVSMGRTNVSTVTINLTLAEEKFRTAKSNLNLANSELAQKKAGSREEDIAIAEAKVNETKNQIKAVEEKIRKSTVYSPMSAQVTKIWMDVGELYPANQVAVSLSSSGKKIQSDISELDIGKITVMKESNVLITFDAYPDIEFSGRVVSIEPKEIEREGDKYYRVNIVTDEQDSRIRSGMNSDLIIQTSVKEDVLKIPEFVVYKKDGVDFVTILNDEKEVEIEIQTGISDREFIEIIEGLGYGQVVVLSNE